MRLFLHFADPLLDPWRHGSPAKRIDSLRPLFSEISELPLERDDALFWVEPFDTPAQGLQRLQHLHSHQARWSAGDAEIVQAGEQLHLSLGIDASNLSRQQLHDLLKALVVQVQTAIGMPLLSIAGQPAEQLEASLDDWLRRREQQASRLRWRTRVAGWAQPAVLLGGALSLITALHGPLLGQARVQDALHASQQAPSWFTVEGLEPERSELLGRVNDQAAALQVSRQQRVAAAPGMRFLVLPLHGAWVLPEQLLPDLPFFGWKGWLLSRQMAIATLPLIAWLLFMAWPHWRPRRASAQALNMPLRLLMLSAGCALTLL